MFNIVIKLDKGIISGISWDNDCWDCSFDTGCVSFDDLYSIYNKSELYTEKVSSFKN